MSSRDASATLIAHIKSVSDQDKAQWQENYVKHGTRAYGVGIPTIRRLVQRIAENENIPARPIRVQTKFLRDLIRHSYTEPKLSAIIYAQLYWSEAPPRRIHSVTSGWFDHEWIFDWNICDWLCVRLLTPLLDRQPEFAEKLVRWAKAPYLWKARAALVPFAQSERIWQYSSEIASISRILIRRDERFSKTAVGWVLREYSKHDPNFVHGFLHENDKYVTPEVRRNACKYL